MKHFGRWFLVVSFLWMAAFPVKAAEGPVFGDVNGDGVYDAVDLNLIFLAYLTGNTVGLARPDLADVAPDPSSDPRGFGDGKIGADDINRLFRGYLNVQTPPTDLRPTVVSETSPVDGETNVAVTRETVFHFSRPLGSTTTLTDDSLHADFGGHRILGHVHLSEDRQVATLFYNNELPAGARIRVTLDTQGLKDVNGVDLDGDLDGAPGGPAAIAFDTVTNSPVPGTKVFGRVFASELEAGHNTGLAGVTITVDGMEETMFAVTDAHGNFYLDPAPAGPFFVHIDGHTAKIGVPPGAYYPLVGKEWVGKPGQETDIGDVFLPLIAKDTLKPVSQDHETDIHMADSVLADHPEFNAVTVTVPGGSLYREDGTKGQMVGISPVPPDRLPGPLPPGLNLPLVITVQSDGTNFDMPAPVCFPNLPDSKTGQKLPPGGKSALWSYNHDTGKWEVVGPMTVTADGTLACTDPGVGIKAPGWHGNLPGCPATGKKGPTPPPKPKAADCPQFESETKSRLAACATYGGLKGGGIAAGGSLVEVICDYIGGFICKQISKKAHTEAIDGAVQAFHDGQECTAFYNNCLACQGYDAFGPCDKSKLPPDSIYRQEQGGSHALSLNPTLAKVLEIESLEQSLTPDLMTYRDISAQMDALLVGVTKDDDLTSAQRAQLSDLSGKLDVLFQDKTPDAFFKPRLDRLEMLSQDLADESNAFSDTPAFFSLEDLDNNFVQRGMTGQGGAIDNLILRPLTHYRLRRLFPDTLVYGEVEFTSPESGTPVTIPRGVAIEDTGLDSDNDGLTDKMEFVIGTKKNASDTDLDGISDLAEIRQGTDPLSNTPAQTGILATSLTPGPALDVSAFNNLIAVADGGAGLSLFNIYQGMPPAIIAQADTPGNAQAVSFSGDLIAVADGAAGLAVVDTSDPTAVHVTHQLPLGSSAKAVATSGNLAFVALESGQVVVADMATGEEISRLNIGIPLHDLAVEEGVLYVSVGSELRAYRLPGNLPEFAGSVATSGFIPEGITGRRRIFVGGGLAYVTSYPGYDVIDVSHPESMQIVGHVKEGGPNSFKQIVTNGSGLGIAAVGVNPRLDGTHDVWVYKTTDPTDTANRLAVISTPGLTRAVSLFNGLAYAADSDNGIQVINYLAFDANGQAPALSLSTNFSGDQAEEGQQFRLMATATDDVQVRNVEFDVDLNQDGNYDDPGEVATDGNFPFEREVVAPRITSGHTTFKVRARASDTGGNFSPWVEKTITLVTDATPPRVLRSRPQNGDKVAQGSIFGVTATFSEPIRPGSLTPDSFKLTRSGPDGTLGTADDVVMTGGTLTYREDLATAFLVFPDALPSDFYRLDVTSPLTDRAGNPVTAYTASFRVKGAVSWIRDGDGFWDDPTAWSDGAVPEPGDFVLIDRPSGNYTITYRTGSLSIQGLVCNETLALTGGTLTVQGSSSVKNLALSGGTLDGDGNVSVTGTLSWSGGGMTGKGTTDVAPGGALTLSGNDDKFIYARSLNNAGTATWTGTGRILGAQQGSVNNLAGAVFEARSDTTMAYQCAPCGGEPAFNNAGTFRKTTTAGITTFTGGARFNNTGTVDIQAGSLRLQGGGTGSGASTIAAGSTIFFSGDYLLANGAAFTGAGTGQLDAGTLTVVGGATTKNFAQSGGTLAGTGTLTATGTFTWTGGAMTDTGSTDIEVGGTLALAGDEKYLYSRTINNRGTANWTQGRIFIAVGGTFNNQAGGTWNLQGDTSMNYQCAPCGTATVNNAGTLRKTSGSGVSGFFGSIPFNNTGAVEVKTGSLSLNGGGTSGGSFVASSGATLDFSGGTQELVAGSSVSGVGTVQFSGGVTNIAGSYAVTGSTNVKGGAGNFNATATTVNGGLSSGSLGGTGKLQITGAFAWTGGEMVGTGSTDVKNGAALALSGGDRVIRERTLNNSGTVSWSGGTILGSNASIINNLAGGLFNSQSDGLVSYQCAPCGGGPTFNNSGTFRKSAGLGETVFGGSAVFNNSGIVQIQAGSLRIDGGGSSSGVFTMTTGREVRFNSDYALTNGSTFTGTGAGHIQAATTTVTGTVTAQNIVLTGGALSGDGMLSISKLLTWTGGAMSGTGSTLVNVGATLAISGDNDKVLTARTIINVATVTWSGAGKILGSLSGIISNQASGLIDIQSDSSLVYQCAPCGGGPSLFNAGTLRKSAGAGETLLGGGTALHNDGNIEVKSGSLHLDGSGTLNGNYFIDPTTAVLITGSYSLEEGVSFTGEGLVRLSAGTTTVAGAASARNFTLEGGTLDGPGTLSTSGIFTWSSGLMTGAGSTSIPVGGTLNISGNADRAIYTRTISNAGTTNWTGGHLFGALGAKVNNLSGGVFNIPQAASFFYQCAPCGEVPTFTNAGSLTLGDPTATVLMGINFTQTATGTLHIQLGGLTPGTDYDQLTGIQVATLDGTLDLSTVSGFSPAAGDSFTAMTFGSHVGEFGTINKNGKAYDVTTHDKDVTVVAQ